MTSPADRGASVLICDDHAVFADSLALVLADAGFRVAGVVYRPGDALPVLARERPDLCLIDLQFPGGTVLEHLARLRAESPATAFVLLSGFLAQEAVEAAAAAGVQGFAHKGRQVRDIVSLLERVLAGETVVDALPSRSVRSDTMRLARYLTPREREVLTRLSRGQSTTDLAKAMGVTRSTARSHVQSVLTKLGVHSQREAVIEATRRGLVSVETGEWLAPDS